MCDQMTAKNPGPNNTKIGQFYRSTLDLIQISVHVQFLILDQKIKSLLMGLNMRQTIIYFCQRSFAIFVFVCLVCDELYIALLNYHLLPLRSMTPLDYLDMHWLHIFQLCSLEPLTTLTPQISSDCFYSPSLPLALQTTIDSLTTNLRLNFIKSTTVIYSYT